MLEVVLLDPKKIDQFPGNVRRRNAPQDVARLAENIKQLAVEGGRPNEPEAFLISPITVRPSSAKPGRFENICGSRRHAALTKLKAKAIPCFVRELTDKQAIEISATENLQRDDLHPIEEADAYKHMLDAGMDVKQIADMAGRSESHVYRRLRLNQMEPEILEDFWSGKHHENVRAEHFIEIAKLPTHAAQLSVYKRLATEPDWRMNIAAFRKWVFRDAARRLKDAPFTQTVQLPVIGSVAGEKLPTCKGCQKRSDAQQALFDDSQIDGVSCLDPVCWDGKVAAHIQHSLDNGMSGIKQEEEWQGNERYVTARDLINKKDTDLPREKVIILEGHDRGKVIQMIPREAVKPEQLEEWARDKENRKPKSVNDGPRKVHKEEKSDIDQAMSLLVGKMRSMERDDAETIFETLMKECGSAVRKLAGARIGLDLSSYEAKASLPQDKKEAHTAVWTLLLTSRCEHYGDQREALKNIAKLAERYKIKGEERKMIDAIYDTWIDGRGAYHANGRDRYKARLAGAAA